MSIKVSRILHAGYILENQSSRILFDPIFESPFSRNCYSYPKVDFDLDCLKNETFAAIFISHYHDDHCSLESLQHLKRNTPIYMYCQHPELFEWLHTMGFTSVVPLQWGKAVIVNNWIITPTRALDEDVDCIFQIETQEFKILNMVDSWMSERTLIDLAKKSPWDLVLWPFQTFRELEILSPSRFDLSKQSEIPFEFAEQLIQLHPRILIPSSCQFLFEPNSWLNDFYFPIRYSDFFKFAEQHVPKSKVVRIEPSESFILDKNTFTKSTPIDWVHPTTSTLVDYGITSRANIPNTATVANMFSPLANDEKPFIFYFCQTSLPALYKNLPIESENYFSKKRVWHLTVHFSQNNSIDYFYQIQNNMLVLMSPTTAIHWRTEIPATRLFGALTNGESLSSLYIRINDQLFDSITEMELLDTDILQDPLLRVMYDNHFCLYQKAQLAKIMGQKHLKTDLA